MTKEQKVKVIRIVVATLIAIGGFFIPATSTFRLVIFIIPYLIVGYDVLIEAVENIFHGKVFDEEFLMTLATVGAFAVGEYPEAAGVMIFYQIGELFQDIAVGKSRTSIASLMDIRPDYAVVLRDEKELRVAPEDVAIGEVIVIKPGEKIPLDGEIVEGNTSVNVAALTGESLPVEKSVSSKVISGSININGVIRVKTQSKYAESTVAKILELVENSSAKKAKAENFITRFSRVYTPCVVVAAVVLAIIPPLLFSGEWSDWINRALIFLMVSCPCALVVSVPLTFFSGIGNASKQGVLIKGANYMETLSLVDTVMFDKTGTLTKGSFAVEAIHPNTISEDALLDIAAAAESYSTHPVGESIVAAHKGHIDKSRIGEVSELAGKGLSAVIDGKIYYVGNEKLMNEVGVEAHKCHLTGTIIHIADEGEYLGHIVINDELKPDTKDAISALKAAGVLKAVMLTGDATKVAEAVASKVGIDEFRAGLLPDGKVSAVEEFLDAGNRVAFVGDGINDAPVLARADVGIAMGALGSDAAIESADIVLMDDKLSKLPLAIKISRKTMRIVKENIWFAISIKIIILVLSAFGLTNMWIAVFGDVGVLILATINALRAMMNSK